MIPSMKFKAGFSLLELLIVLAIVAIISAIAYPAYTSHILKTHRAQAKVNLLALANQLEQYHILNHSYQGANLATLNFKAGDEFYRYEMQTTEKSFLIKAIPVGKQTKDSCGTLIYNETGEKSSSTNPEISACW